MNLYNRNINRIGSYSGETSKLSPYISPAEFVKFLVTDIDANFIESKGDISSVNYLIPECIRFAYMTDNEFQEVKKLMPAGLAITRATSDRYNAGDPNRLVIDVSISSTYVSSINRFAYYSEEFASRLINNRSEELKAIQTGITRHSWVQIHDIGIRTGLDDPDKHSVLFESLNLKPLTTFSQRYTLAKVLEDRLRRDNPDWECYTQVKTCYRNSSYEPYEVIQDFVITMYQKFKEPPQPPKILSDW